LCSATAKVKPFSAFGRDFVRTSVWNFAEEMNASSSIFRFAGPSQMYRGEIIQLERHFYSALECGYLVFSVDVMNATVKGKM